MSTDDLTNLLEETLKDLAGFGKIPEDVKWVQKIKWVHKPTENEPYAGQTHVQYCSWDEFANQAKDINYDAGYGTAMINMSLKVVGNGWWLERHEYDGSEHWSIRTVPTIQGATPNPNMRIQDYKFKPGTTQIDWSDSGE